MSASAPLGNPSTKTGRVEAAWTSATITTLSVSEVISQADATSFIHIVTLAASQANHSMRKTGSRSGPSGEDGGSSASAGGSAVAARLSSAALMVGPACTNPAVPAR